MGVRLELWVRWSGRVWVSRWMKERSSTAGDALLMGSALRCCDPAAAGGPVHDVAAGLGGRRWLSEASVILRQAGGGRRCLQHASGGRLISRTINTPTRPYKPAPPPDSSKQSIVSTSTPIYPRSSSTTQLLHHHPNPLPNHPLQNDRRKVRRQGQRLQVQRPIVSLPYTAPWPQFGLGLLFAPGGRSLCLFDASFALFDASFLHRSLLLNHHC